MDYEVWALHFELQARKEESKERERRQEQKTQPEDSQSPGILTSSTLPTRSDDAERSYRNELSPPRFSPPSISTTYDKESSHSKPKAISFINHGSDLVTVQSSKPVNTRKKEKPYWESSSSDEQTVQGSTKINIPTNPNSIQEDPKLSKPYWESSPSDDETTRQSSYQQTLVKPLAKKEQKPYWESSSSDEDKTPLANRLSSRRRTGEHLKNIDHHHDNDNHDHDHDDDHTARIPCKAKDSDTSLLSNIQLNKGNPKKKVNNPIIQWRQQQEDLQLKLQTKLNTNYSSRPTLQDDLLWETSSSDNERRNERKHMDGKGKRKRKNEHQTKEMEGWNQIVPPPAGQQEQEAIQTSCIHSEEEDEEETEESLLKQLKPNFVNPKLGPPSELVPMILPTPQTSHEQTGVSMEDTVPASINRYLQEYQREGIRFMHKALRNHKGVILGDDMGLGKTVQVISLLAAFQKKTGTALDAKNIKEREKLIQMDISQRRKEANAMFTIERKEILPSRSDVVQLTPTLIIVPSSVIDNWKREFESWGHFAVSLYQGSERVNELERVRVGINDIMICGKALFVDDANLTKMEKVPWKLIIVDEFHEFKNLKAKCYEQLYNLREQSKCPILGLTGTLMANNHKELWALIDMVHRGLLGSWDAFNKMVSLPIMHSRRKDATEDMLALGEKRQRELFDRLSNTYLKRDKADVLKNALTTKDERVVFCELSNVQKMIYQRILSLADYKLLRFARSPCDCGVNQEFFSGYRLMRNRKEQMEYQKRHKNSIIPRAKCCYAIPTLEDGFIDPEAVLWRTFHPKDEPCPPDKRGGCPYCILLPALHKLHKVCSHPSLLQIERDPQYIEDEKERDKAFKALAFAKVALSQEILQCLPGKSYVRGDSIMDDHMMLSGKMVALDYYLSQYASRGDRVLVFSYSTRTLDLIQHYVRGQGYTHVRLDGSTPTSKRQSIIDEFQKNEDIFLFLISTKAGGLGLNLTAANRVIVYDVNWNPSYDEQAQDRAYRIGQSKDVEVIRFVARGTIEELMYARQIYKVHLKKQTLESTKDQYLPQPARLFSGVDKDKVRKGELFGLENLLKYKDGSFMADMWSSKENEKIVGKKKIPEVIATDTLATFLGKLSEEQMNQLGGEEAVIDVMPEEDSSECSGVDDTVIRHDDFLRDDRGGAVNNDEDFGGETQMACIANELAIERLGAKSPVEKLKSEEKDKGRRSLKLPSYLRKG